jgi:hypothetical protein
MTKKGMDRKLPVLHGASHFQADHYTENLGNLQTTSPRRSPVRARGNRGASAT